MIFKFKNKSLEINSRTYIMGILNVTPDSFSDGGKYNNIDLALNHVQQMISEGADFIDIGGESTRPGHENISVEQELERVVPFVETIKRNFDIPLSIDTYKPAVAHECIKVGADIVNDIWGLQKYPEMAQICSQHNVGIIAMHNADKQVGVDQDIVTTLNEFVEKVIDVAVSNKISLENLVFDPGFGFAKSYENNINLLARLNEVDFKGLPYLVGISKKSMIGNTLNLPPEERLEGTIVCDTIAIYKGANIIRVHDVKEAKRAAVMVDKIIGRI